MNPGLPDVESWLAAIVRSCSDAVVGEAAGAIVSWNAGAELLYGWSAGEIAGRPLSALWPADRAGELSRLKDEPAPGFETVHVRKDQRRIDVSLSLSPVFGSDGVRAGWSLIVRDVSARRRAWERLEESEQRHRELMEQASDAIFVADLEGRYREVNPAACTLLGARREELIGLTIMDLVPEEDLPRLAEVRRRLVIEPGRTETAEWRLRRRDGTFVQVEVSAKVLPDGRWHAIVRDVTARKRAEAELARARESERRLRERLEAVMAATTSISEALLALPETDLRTVLHACAEQAQRLTGARYAAIGIGSDPEQPFDPWVQAGVSGMDEAIIGAVPRPVGVLGHVARTGEVLRIDDLSQHPGFRGMPSRHPAMRSFLGVPVRHAGQVVGNLYLTDKDGGQPFTADDVRAMELLAQRVGVALLTARLLDAEHSARSFLQGVVDQLPDGVVVLDGAGHMVTCNRAALALTCGPTGRKDEYGNEIRFDLRTASGEPLQFEEIPVVRAIRDRRTVRGVRIALATADGRLVPVEVNAAPLRGARGQHAGAVAVFRQAEAIKASGGRPTAI